MSLPFSLETLAKLVERRQRQQRTAKRELIDSGKETRGPRGEERAPTTAPSC